MKTAKLGMMLGVALLTASCLSEEQNLAPVAEDGQKGKVVLELSTDASFSASTRAVNEDNYRNPANYTVKLMKGDEVLEEFSAAEIADKLPIELKPAEYTIVASYGSEQNYSRNVFYMEGRKDFNVSKGTESRVSVNCEPTCGKLSVVFDATMADYYDSYSVSYSGAAAFGASTLSWLKNDTEPWYVKLNADGEQLTYTINVHVKDDYAHVDADGNKQDTGTATGTFTLKRNHSHKLTVRPNYTPTAEGGLTLEITIDDTLNEKRETIEVPVSWI